MNSNPDIKTLPFKKLAGKKVNMSISENRTSELWRSFMPAKDRIDNRVGTELYSVEIYDDPLFFENFDPDRIFEKWVAVEVNDFFSIPEELERLTIKEGLYAVFLYKGKASEVSQLYQYVLGVWLPQAGYSMDNRPHFAVMGDKYKNEDPDSEEEICIPIRKCYPKKI